MKTVLFLLGELDNIDVEWLLEAGHKQEVPSGQVLFHEDKPVTDLHLILEGEFSVRDMEVGGQELARLTVGEILGEMELIDGRPAAATVTAVESATLLTIPHSAMQARLERDVGFSSRFYRSMSHFLVSRLRGTVASLSDFSGDEALDEDAFYDDELDEDALDNLGLAGDRFDRILQRMLAG